MTVDDTDDPLPLIDDREDADIVVDHQSCRRGYLVIGRHADDGRRHHPVHGGVCLVLHRYADVSCAQKIAAGDDADDLVLLHHRERDKAAGDNQAIDLVYGFLWRTGDRLLRHDVPDPAGDVAA